MVGKKDIKKFWKYVENTFEKDEIESALDAFEFERKYLKDEELDKLSPEEIQKYIAETRQDIDTPQIGYTKVVYYYNILEGVKAGNISHSAKVYSVNSNGTVNKVISKWGNNGLFIHAIDESPYTYAIFNPEVDYFNY